MRFIRTCPLPMAVSQQQRWFEIAATLGVTDTEGFYLFAVAMVNLIAASAEYLLLIALWRPYSLSRQKP